MELDIPAIFPEYDPLKLKVITPESADKFYPTNLINYAVAKSTEKIKTLAPDVAVKAIALYRAAYAWGFLPYIYSGRRSLELQSVLYKKYQSGKGLVAAPPGRSFHNYGRAFDIMIFTQDGKGEFEYALKSLNLFNERLGLGLWWGDPINDPNHFADKSISIEKLQQTEGSYKAWLQNTTPENKREAEITETILKDTKDFHQAKLKDWFKKNIRWAVPTIVGLIAVFVTLIIIKFRSE